MSCLELQSLSLRIGSTIVCRDLSMSISASERWALLGKNGAGKTTLLHSILGLHKPDNGLIFVNNKPLKEFKRQELARYLGILFQDGMHAMPNTVLESVLLGRHPHTHSWLIDTESDLEMAIAALRLLDLESFAERQIDSLSGGEKQRMALAMLLAQTPKLYLLDEPSNHLDLAFQVKLIAVLDQELKKQNSSVLMATHDINLAARFCDHFLLLLGNGEFLIGNREEVLTESALTSAYGCSMQVLTSGDTQFYLPALVQ